MILDTMMTPASHADNQPFSRSHSARRSLFVWISVRQPVNWVPAGGLHCSSHWEEEGRTKPSCHQWLCSARLFGTHEAFSIETMNGFHSSQFCPSTPILPIIILKHNINVLYSPISMNSRGLCFVWFNEKKHLNSKLGFQEEMPLDEGFPSSKLMEKQLLPRIPGLRDPLAFGKGSATDEKPLG